MSFSLWLIRFQLETEHPYSEAFVCQLNFELVSTKSFKDGAVIPYFTNPGTIKKQINMDEFILIFRHENGKDASPEQIQAWMKQTMDWIGVIAAQNKFVSGNGTAL